MLFQASKICNFARQCFLGGLVATSLGVSGANAQNSAELFTGVDANRNGGGAYAGFVYAFNGDIDTSGWTVASVFSYSIFKDSSVIPTATASSTGAVFTFGYQWHTPDYFLTLALGADVIDNVESPSTGSPTEGRKFGGVAQIGFETKATNAMYLNGFGVYHTANERTYLQLRAGYKTDSYAYGLEGVYANELGSDGGVTLGAFVSGIEFGQGKLGFSIGGLNVRDSNIFDGAYVAVEYSIPLGF